MQSGFRINERGGKSFEALERWTERCMKGPLEGDSGEDSGIDEESFGEGFDLP